MDKKEPDIILAQEENKVWENIPEEEKPKYVFDTEGISTNHAYNTVEQSFNNKHLQGGTAVWIRGSTRGYIKGT